MNEDPRGDWMQTWLGHRFYPMAPSQSTIDHADIAHALSQLCRFAGHIDRFYSVAEHCVLMSQAVPPEHALAALLHDATEAYVVDVPRPLKRYLPDYQAIEQQTWYAIAYRFGLDFELPAEVKDADNRILRNERAALFSRAEAWPAIDDLEPLPVQVIGLAPLDAELAYLRRLAEVARIPGLDVIRVSDDGTVRETL